jgi:hypothetical protein
MPPVAPPENVDRPVSQGPVYWFVKLACAVEDGDFSTAAEAQRELKRLGVIIRYLRPAAPQPVGPKLHDRKGADDAAR